VGIGASDFAVTARSTAGSRPAVLAAGPELAGRVAPFFEEAGTACCCAATGLAVAFFEGSGFCKPAGLSASFCDAARLVAGCLDVGSIVVGSPDANSFDASSFNAGSFDAGSFNAGSFNAGSFEGGCFDEAG